MEQYLEKIEWGTINWLTKKKMTNLWLSSTLCVYGEYAKNEQSLKNLSISNSFGLKPKLCEILVLYPR